MVDQMLMRPIWRVKLTTWNHSLWDEESQSYPGDPVRGNQQDVWFAIQDELTVDDPDLDAVRDLPMDEAFYGMDIIPLGTFMVSDRVVEFLEEQLDMPVNPQRCRFRLPNGEVVHYSFLQPERLEVVDFAQCMPPISQDVLERPSEEIFQHVRPQVHDPNFQWALRADRVPEAAIFRSRFFWGAGLLATDRFREIWEASSLNAEHIASEHQIQLEFVSTFAGKQYVWV